MATDGGNDRVFVGSVPPDSYTAFLHDAVMLFATAADGLIKDTGQDWFEGDSVPFAASRCAAVAARAPAGRAARRP